MKKIIIILLMLAGLALNLTDNGLEIVSRNTVRAQTWDGDFNNNSTFASKITC